MAFDFCGLYEMMEVKEEVKKEELVKEEGEDVEEEKVRVVEEGQGASLPREASTTV